MNKRIAILIVFTTGFFAAVVVVAGALIHHSAVGRTYTSVVAIPHRRVGLVLGCSKHLGVGYLNPFFQYRIKAAAELYRAGKVDYLIVSGDNHIHAYNEARDMKDSLVELGVPKDRIYCDYAGFRTLDSVVRAQAVFGQSQITIISQDFHTQRAIFIARHRGIDAIGFNAEDVSAYYSFGTHCREQASKVNAILEIFVFDSRPRFYGPKVLVGIDPPLDSISELIGYFC